MKTAICAAALFGMIGFSAAVTGCGKMGPVPGRDGPAETRHSASPAETKKIVVARVNGTPITMDALVNMMNRMGPPRDGGEIEIEKVKKAALDQLIMQELAYQQAKARDITVEQETIDEAVSRFRGKIGGELEFTLYLGKQGMTETAFRAELERAFMVQKMYEREVLGKAAVPEDVIQQEYEREKHRYEVPEKLFITDVFFIKSANPNGKAKKAAAVRTKILKDPARDPWKLVLDGTFIVRSIELNRELHPELYRAAKKMKSGNLSDVISTDDGLHVIVLDTVVPGRVIPFEEARRALEDKYRPAARQKRLLQWKAELKRAAEIEILQAQKSVGRD